MLATAGLSEGKESLFRLRRHNNCFSFNIPYVTREVARMSRAARSEAAFGAYPSKKNEFVLPALMLCPP
jgi:hypothetical protein